jgi:hypothetical protein
MNLPLLLVILDNAAFDQAAVYTRLTCVDAFIVVLTRIGNVASQELRILWTNYFTLLDDPFLSHDPIDQGLVLRTTSRRSCREQFIARYGTSRVLSYTGMSCPRIDTPVALE